MRGGRAISVDAVERQILSVEEDGQQPIRGRPVRLRL
jgi:hypothetical protein